MQHFNKIKHIASLSLVSLSVFLLNCQVPSQDTVKPVEINSNIKFKNGSNVFSVKNSAPVLFLPFSGSCEDGCGKAEFTYTDNNGNSSTSSFGELAGISISADGKASIGVSTRGGQLYTGTQTSASASINASSPFTAGSGGIDTSGEPCGPSGSYKTHDSSALTIPTYYFKSGNLNLSLNGYDLVGEVTGITSDNKAPFIAPWDGSCRLSSHPDRITSGTIKVTLKNVAVDPIDLSVSKKLISLNPDNDSDMTSTDISVTASNKGTWNLAVGSRSIDSGTTDDKTVTIDKDNTYGLTDGDYTGKVVLNASAGNQRITDSLQIDSTPPVIEDIEIFDSTSPVRIEVKVKDPVVNGFKSDIDPNKTKIESSLGGTSSFDGNDTITYTFPDNIKLDEIKENSNSGNLSIKIYDKAGNKHIEPINLLKMVGGLGNNSEGLNFGGLSNKNFQIKDLIDNETGRKVNMLYLSDKVDTDSRCKKYYTIQGTLSTVFDDWYGGEITIDIVKVSSFDNYSTFGGVSNYLGFDKGYSYFSSFTVKSQLYEENGSFELGNSKLDHGNLIVQPNKSWDLKDSKGNYLSKGEYYIIVRKAKVYHSNPKHGTRIGQFPFLSYYGKFKVVTGNTGDGPYSHISDNGFKIENGRDFSPTQRDRIYADNFSRHQLLIRRLAKAKGITKEEEIKNLLLSDTNPPELLQKPLSSTAIKPYKPTISGIRAFGFVDHIVFETPPKLTKNSSDSCFEAGSNSFSNARLIANTDNSARNNLANRFDYP